MRTTIILCFLVLCLIGTVSAQTSGSLTVNGKAVHLTNAQAMDVQDWEYNFKTKKYAPIRVVRVFLSDAPVDDIQDNFDLFLKGRQDKLHAVLITINKKGVTSDGQVIHQAFTNGAISFSGEGLARFERKVLDAKTVAGTLRTDAPQEFEGRTYEFNVTFNAAIQQEPKPTVEGSSAETSGPGKAVREFLNAAGSKDVPSLKRIFRAEIAAMLDDPNHKEEVMGLLGESYPPGKKFTIARVFDFGNRAWVEALSKRPSESGGAPIDETTRIRLVRVNGEWKVQPM